MSLREVSEPFVMSQIVSLQIDNRIRSRARLNKNRCAKDAMISEVARVKGPLKAQKKKYTGSKCKPSCC